MEKITFNEFRRDILIIFFILLITNIFFLLNTGIYWDDWVWFNYLGKQPSVGRFKILSFIDPYRINPSITRVLLFFSDCLAALFLYFILKHSEIVGDYAVYIVLIAQTVPIYLARYTFCCSDYYFSLFFFYCASFFYCQLQSGKKYSKLRGGIYHAVSIYFYIKSFQTASFFVFYIVPFVYGYYLINGKQEFSLNKLSIKKIISYLWKNLLYLLLPFLMYLIKMFFFKPENDYINYYSVSLINIIKSPFLFIISASQMIKGIFQLSLSLIISSSDYLFVFLCVYFLVKIYEADKEKMLCNAGSTHKCLFVISLIMGFFGTFAYSSLGFTGVLNSWDSRHFLLLGLPVAFFLYSLGLVICKNEIGKFDVLKVKILFSVIILFFSMDTFYMGYNMYKKNIEEDYLITQFKKSDLIKNNQMFIIENDNKNELFQNMTRFYDYSGYAYKAYGTRNHLIFDKNDRFRMKEILSIKDGMDYKIKDVTVQFVQGEIYYSLNISVKNVIKAIVLKALNNENYNSYIETLGKFEVNLY